MRRVLLSLVLTVLVPPGAAGASYAGGPAAMNAATEATTIAALFVTFDRSGKLQRVRAPKALRHYGRIRQVVSAGNADLLVTTDNGGGHDVILRVIAR